LCLGSPPDQVAGVMAELAASHQVVTPKGRRRIEGATLALGLLLAVTTILKLTVYSRQPLSIDEVWTGMIAGQGSVAGLIHECQRDVNGPLAYVISWLWAQVSGLSNGALRAPSLLFACAAPFLALAPHRLANRTVRYAWAALLACWMPGLIFAEQARCYALVLLLATANAIAYARLLSRPSLVMAFVWTSVSALFILSHYVAGLLVACQGLAYLAIHRRQAFRTWPAALVFGPTLACMAFQAVSLMAFARPTTAMIPPMNLSDVIPTASLLLGGAIAWPLVAIWACAGLIAARRSALGPASAPSGSPRRALVWTAATAILAAMVCLAIGLARPIVSPRFMTIFAPGVMLGLALMAERLSHAWKAAPAALAAGALGLALAFSAMSLFVSPPTAGAMFSFEPAAQSLMASHPRRLIFFWDNPASSGGDHGQLAQIGGFLFKRANHPIPVEVVAWTAGADPNQLILSRAQAPGDAILWIYDRHVIEHRNPAWNCHDFGDNNVGIVACQGRAKA
jgi:hypothetical protein